MPSLDEIFEQLRLRLLDLTSRNRLLNFKPSVTKSLQIVDAVPNAVFDRLLGGKACTFIPVPDPAPTDYILQGGRRIRRDVREYAGQRGIDTNLELPSWSENIPITGSEGNRLRALYYPEDLDRQCRRIAREAQSAIEETGTNMLYLVFGFLEFYESDDAERPLNAPLLALPVSLKRGGIDPQTRLSRYDLTYSGEEITENLSLREKLKQEFGIHLPELKEEERPEDYIDRIRQAIARKHRWNVKRQMTLGLLSFAKMMLVQDIDPKNWPRGRENSRLLEHSIVQGLFLGNSTSDSDGNYPAPYLIDEHRENGFALELIYDADTSQHCALIDALSGRNMVINGPPGTGKSQTITNLIALAMLRGKKVLFVSEKLAALEVVKHRLDQAGLGDFCLELHSHKTDKKRVVEEIKKRRDSRYVTVRGLEDKLQVLEERRKRLKKYADLMNAKVGNELGLSVFEILWKAEHHRKKASLSADSLEAVVVEEASHADSTRLDEMRRAIADLALHYREISSYGPQHPWFGFFPDCLNPGDNLRLRRFLADLIDDTRRFEQAMAVLRQNAFTQPPGSKAGLQAFAQCVQTIEEPGPRVITELLPGLFSENDPMARTSQIRIQQLQGLCDEARNLAQVTESNLRDSETITETTLGEVQAALLVFRHQRIATRTLEYIRRTLADVRGAVTRIGRALDAFREAAALTGLPFDETDASVLRTFDIVAIAHQLPQELHAFRHQGLNHASARTVLSEAQEQLSNLYQQQQALERVFWLDDQPEGSELLQAIRILRQGDKWYRIFQGEWRWACRLHKTLSRDKNAHKSAADRLEELTELAKYRKAVAKFHRNQEYSQAFGALFCGMDTDFEKIDQLVAWYEKARTTLLRHGLSPEALDLTTFDSNRLSQLALRMESDRAHYQATNEAAECIDLALRNTRVHDAAANARHPWTERLAALEAFLNEIEASVRQLEPLGLSTLTPEEILNAVVARRRYTSLLEQIESQADVQNLLGDHFRGLNTDFPSILETIEWGRRVVQASLPDETAVALLTGEASERIANLKSAAADAWEAACFDDRFGDKMRQCGDFNWEQWKSAGPSVATQISTEAIRVRAELALGNMEGLLSWAQYNRAREEIIRLSLKPFAEHLEAGDLGSDAFEDAFLYRFYSSIAVSLFGSRNELGRFSGMTHAQVREGFSQLDKEVISLRGRACAANIARQASPPSGISGFRVEDKTEMALLNHLMTLQRPRTPIRRMIRRAGGAIQALNPCFMMSPLSVAQYLEPGTVEFDLVVMDEASQLKIEEALGAIARGKQLVVVGDQKQLPPTSFFDRMMTVDDELDEGTAVTSTESILDICNPLFPNRTLRWHYRSKHESLIAFSNHHFYNGQLIVFPSPYPKSKRLGLRFHYIQDGVYQNRQNFKEAERVVDAVLGHMRSHPDDSLGVVTLNITQRDLIEEILNQKLKYHEEGESYTARWENEGWPLFVKNLENVQGDERDVVFISTTFGRAQGTTVVRQNFGPISRPMGWRRLNVLFTRARKSLQIFSSMQPEDIVIDENTPEGTRTLRNYLEYAARGVLVGPDITEREPDSDFEVVVADALKSKGYEVQSQLGVAGYFIDIAVRNPDRPGEFLAAIECDGATYHSGASVRDRDRIRQEILESLGWKGKIWRIWSPDWFRNPQTEATRLLAFLEERRRAAAQEPTPHIAEEDVQEGANNTTVREEAPVQVDLAIRPVDEDEELYVEVGDTVTYCDVEAPTERKQVLITDGLSNFEQGIINAATPLARTLLDRAEGEEVDLVLPGRGPRRLRVLTIHRNNRSRSV